VTILVTSFKEIDVHFVESLVDLRIVDDLIRDVDLLIREMSSTKTMSNRFILANRIIVPSMIFE